MPASATDQNNKSSLDLHVFVPSFLLVSAASLALILNPETATIFALEAMNAVTGYWGWLYMLIGTAAAVFCGWLAFGRYGKIVLGDPHETPEYADMHWVAMMFTAGIGAGLVQWGFAECIYYMTSPPYGLEPMSARAIEWAHMYPMFHWGITPWAIYALPAVPVAYMLFVRKARFMRISTICDAALPQRHREAWKTVIDIFVVFAITGAIATSLGLGVPLVSAFVAELFGVEDTVLTKVGVLLVWTAVFGTSTWRGLKKGIKLLADINMVLAAIMILFVLLAGPTLLILKFSTNSIGLLIDNYFRMSFWMDPVLERGFPEAWTVFYWAWWLAYVPLMGLFYGRISRGRTIRQVIIGVIGWGTLGTWVYLAIAGGFTISLEINGIYPVAESLAKTDLATTTARIVAQLPFSELTLALFTVLCIVFYATNLDSAAYVLASVCTRNLPNDEEPARYHRMIWAFSLAVVAGGIALSGSLETTKSATVIVSLMMIPIVVLMCVSQVRWFHEDFDVSISKVRLRRREAE
ncbi:MAG: BCCT family transporter [Gammaproteobacteria bacterium]|nr:BCCT family transporter [Gammaproteobacteria bacterium]